MLWAIAHSLVNRQYNLMRWHTKEASKTKKNQNVVKKNACESLPKICKYGSVRQIKIKDHMQDNNNDNNTDSNRIVHLVE